MKMHLTTLFSILLLLICSTLLYIVWIKTAAYSHPDIKVSFRSKGDCLCSSGALYPVPHLDDYVSLLLLKALIPTLNESLNIIFHNIFIHSYYVFCFVDGSLSNAIAKACIKTFLSKAKKELGAEAELISLKRGQFATGERLGRVSVEN